jgi:hypothetical protein
MVFDTIVNSYRAELNRVSRTFVREPEVDMDKYLYTLLWMHVLNVKDQLSREYRQLAKKLAVPAAFMTFLAQVGEVIDRDFAIRFVPTIEADAPRLLSPSEMLEMSDELYSLTDHGFHAVQGLPRPEDSGSVGAMAACMLETGEIRSYRRDHPVYGLVAAALQFNELATFLGVNALRIRYGALSEYELLASSFSRMRHETQEE